jgi:HPt (histidine-containing phosphotransfer) domain-containing protein
MNFKDIASNLGLDEKDLNELLGIFITTSFTDIGKINSGLKENNTEKTALAAHSIKGAAANLGFEKIASMSKDIEMTAKEGSTEGLEEKANTIIEELKKIETTIKTD